MSSNPYFDHLTDLPAMPIGQATSNRLPRGCILEHRKEITCILSSLCLFVLGFQYRDINFYAEKSTRVRDPAYLLLSHRKMIPFFRVYKGKFKLFNCQLKGLDWGPTGSEIGLLLFNQPWCCLQTGRQNSTHLILAYLKSILVQILH